jgi:hypothetical protein
MTLPALAPVAVSSNWVDAHLDTETADNGGTNPVKEPDALVSASHRLLQLTRGVETLQIRMRYDDADTVTTPPTVQVFGYDENGVGMLLEDSAQLADDADDYSDGTYEYTTAIDVPAKGCRYAIVAIQIAAAAAGDDPIVQARAF